MCLKKLFKIASELNRTIALKFSFFGMKYELSKFHFKTFDLIFIVIFNF